MAGVFGEINDRDLQGREGRQRNKFLWGTFWIQIKHTQKNFVVCIVDVASVRFDFETFLLSFNRKTRRSWHHIHTSCFNSIYSLLAFNYWENTRSSEMKPSGSYAFTAKKAFWFFLSVCLAVFHYCFYIYLSMRRKISWMRQFCECTRVCDIIVKFRFHRKHEMLRQLNFSRNLQIRWFVVFPQFADSDRIDF